MRFNKFEGDIYRTQLPLGNRIEASLLLRRIDEKLRTLVRYLGNKYNNKSSKYYVFVKNLIEDYNTDSIQETHPLEKGETSYVMRDGKILSLCIRYRINGGATNTNNYQDTYTFHDLNTLVFVGIHELTHIAMDQVDHNEKFWRVFKWMLIEAVDIGVYVPVNYFINPIMYCEKINISYSPLYDIYMEEW